MNAAATRGGLVLLAVACLSASTTSAGQGGSGGCNPFELVSASGDLYCFASASGQQLPLTIPVDADALLGAEVFGQRIVGSPLDANYALSQGFVFFGQGDLFSIDCMGRGTAQASTGQYAFARTDISVWSNLMTNSVKRVRGQWSLHGSGISHLTMKLTRPGVAGVALEVDVNTYITPEVDEGSFELVLPESAFALQVYGSVQANSGFENPDDGLYGGVMWMSCFPLEDLTGDGLTNAQDLAVILSSWGPVAPYHTADLDQDGQVGASDLALILAAWD